MKHCSMLALTLLCLKLQKNTVHRSTRSSIASVPNSCRESQLSVGFSNVNDLNIDVN
jgi:ABC-type phosphate transport system permease subunit